MWLDFLFKMLKNGVYYSYIRFWRLIMKSKIS
jgi:hypothetical protein